MTEAVRDLVLVFLVVAFFIRDLRRDMPVVALPG
jgi:hypothetical protein